MPPRRGECRSQAASPQGWAGHAEPAPPRGKLPSSRVALASSLPPSQLRKAKADPRRLPQSRGGQRGPGGVGQARRPLLGTWDPPFSLEWSGTSRSTHSWGSGPDPASWLLLLCSFDIPTSQPETQCSCCEPLDSYQKQFVLPCPDPAAQGRQLVLTLQMFSSCACSPQHCGG